MFISVSKGVVNKIQYIMGIVIYLFIYLCLTYVLFLILVMALIKGVFSILQIAATCLIIIPAIIRFILSNILYNIQKSLFSFFITLIVTLTSFDIRIIMYIYAPYYESPILESPMIDSIVSIILYTIFIFISLYFYLLDCNIIKSGYPSVIMNRLTSFKIKNNGYKSDIFYIFSIVYSRIYLINIIIYMISNYFLYLGIFYNLINS